MNDKEKLEAISKIVDEADVKTVWTALAPDKYYHLVEALKEILES